MPPPLANRSILYAMAVPADYGPHLKARIDPLMTGVGPVEAAVAVSRELAARAAEGRLPMFVVSLGSAGSNRLQQTEIYQALSVAYRDMDASALGFEPGLTPYLGLPPALPLGPYVPGVPKATLSSGANVVTGAAYDGIAADMVDMETYAVKRAAMAFEVPLIALRGISDGDRELRRVEDWAQYLNLIDEKLATIVDHLEAAVDADLMEWPEPDYD
ncbi:MAG TPA: 5'-methylthioadenosine/S-adenosylhomocysteine nucleosidase [Alphaproteobacteria bacterium]|nr:5'-methylthioadenosine/S-adenosylhomocysteine nucleosidase [Alphaproteobacteria bacterium]